MTVTVAAPLRTEAAAVRLGLGGFRLRGFRRVAVVRTGAGAHRARRWSPPPSADGPVLVVLGVCGAVRAGLAPGHLLVADRLVGYASADGPDVGAGAASLAARLGRHGLAASTGAIASTERLVRGGPARRALAAAGIDAVDLESAGLVAAWCGAPGSSGAGAASRAVVVRAVVDTPDAELLSPTTVTGGLRALGALRRAAPVVVAWATEHHISNHEEASHGSPPAPEHEGRQLHAPTEVGRP